MKFLFTALTLLMFSSSVSAKNLILFIGDGMGPAVVGATRIYKKSPLVVDSFEHGAFVQTHSANNHVTDSAASATAIAIGHLTDNKAVGISSTELKTGKTPKEAISLAKIAKQKGKSVAIITDTAIVDATPAAFYARSKSRYESESIMQQLFQSDVDLFIGGGINTYEKVKQHNKKFQVITNKTEWNKVNKLTKPILYLIAKNNAEFLKTQKSQRPSPATKDILAKTIDLLKGNPKGYFIMMESGLIDKALHLNEAKWALNQTLDLDAALKVAKAKTSSRETLIVVTADHDTSGLAINGYPDSSKDVFQKIEYGGAKYDFLTFATGPKSPHKSKRGAHTGVDIHLFATGKSSTNFHGTMHHSDSYKIMKDYLITP